MFRVDHFNSTRDMQCEHKVYLLTHAHLDHGTFAKAFACDIHCTPTTRYLLQRAHEDNLNVSLKDDLHVNEWCDIAFGATKTMRIFVFDSGHCMGSVGFYSSQEGILYFGDSRPSSSTLYTLHHIVCSLVPPKKGTTLQIVGDNFFSTAFPHMPSTFDTPTLSQSRHILTSFLHDKVSYVLEHEQHELHIHLCLAHFGALTVLPLFLTTQQQPNNVQIKYQWVGSKSAIGTRLCEIAFELWNTMHHRKQQLSCCRIVNVYVSRMHDKDLEWPFPEAKTLRILLSASWYFVQHRHGTHNPDWLTNPVKISPNTYRIFVCSHATPFEQQYIRRQFPFTVSH